MKNALVLAYALTVAVCAAAVDGISFDNYVPGDANFIASPDVKIAAGTASVQQQMVGRYGLMV